MKKIHPGPLLFLFLGLIIAGAVTWMSEYSQPKLAENIEAKRHQMLQDMLPVNRDNLSLETFELLSPNYLNMGDIQHATRILIDNKPSEVIYTALSKKAYHDKIGVMAGFNTDCTVTQVKIISERETPGLGNQYKNNDFAWLKSLTGKSTTTQWALKPIGDIDSWTGATVTPQAIIDTLKKMQELCVKNTTLLFGHEDVLYLELEKPNNADA